jgi:acetyl-CoA/propionyl-CoA carboxylase biotin carboxyl carrier protein
VFSKVLVANRGEIAVRIIRALEELGIASVAVYSELDRDSVAVARADEAYLLGGALPSESYLNIERILAVAHESGAQAIHPGYGFLAENAAFVARCEEEGIVFIGPPASAIAAMGSKTRARELMAAAGVPIVPGTTEPVKTVAAARRAIAAGIGYPVAIKAAGGGGGKGFRVARVADELADAFEGAAREGEKFFGDPTVYLERYLPDPRHVEVQVLADSHGNVVHLGERDCSIQRRHQKLIEESPAPAWIVDDALRAQIGEVAIEAARAVDYRGAGTVEGLLADGEYHFLEMNTRVQVEHCVTEMTTGIDIVKTGIAVAAGEPLPFTQQDVVLRGHAIECRINAEDAAARFLPHPGRIVTYREPSGPGVRVDSGVRAGSEISQNYDPMIAKLIVWDSDRSAATRRMLRALGEFEITGLRTLIPFHQRLLATDQWSRGETCRDLLEDDAWLASTAPAGQAEADADADADGGSGAVTLDYTVEVGGRRFDVRVSGQPGGSDGRAAARAPRPARARRTPRASTTGAAGGGDLLRSPMQGTVLKIAVEAGAAVRAGALVAVIEAMKMENEITAHKDGTVTALPISVGSSVASGDTLAVIESP